MEKRRSAWVGIVALAAVGSGGCALYLDDPPPAPVPAQIAEYQLVPRGNVAVLGQVSAIAWDGQQHWIVSRMADGDYWSPDPIEVFAYDATTQTASAPYVLTTHWERPTGATWAQGQLWIHYDANTAGLVTSLDPATGVETPRYNVSWGINDIDSDGTSLYLADSSVDSMVEVRDLDTGSLQDQLWSAGFEASLRGLAVIDVPETATTEVWGGTMASNRLTVLVDGEQVAAASLPGFGANNPGLLQFAGPRLTYVYDNQLYFFDVLRPAAN
ncbi:MAG: hypothetical protein R3B06_09085 [Kofleriaceae bacterium]